MAVKVKQHKGKYWIFIDHKGKRKAKCIGSKQAAETAAKKIEAKLTLGDFTLLDEKPQRPFDAYFRNWLDTYVKAHCKERTYDLYGAAFRLYLLPTFGQKDITAITREPVKKVDYGMLAKGKCSGYGGRVVVTPSEMFNRAVEGGHTDHTTCSKILRKTRQEKGEQRPQGQGSFLTREELGVLLRTCQEHYPASYPFVSLLARTGLRCGEAVALQWDDLDFHGRFIDVRRTFSHGRLTTPKSGKGRRVDMSQQLTETLKALLVERKKEALRQGWGEVPPRVFLSPEGAPMDQAHFYNRVWRKLLAKAGLRYIRIHDLRHTF